MALDHIDETFGDEKEMSFFDHIDALRGHLFRSAIAVVTLSVVAFVNKHILFDVIIFGPTRVDFWTYRLLCDWSFRLTGSDSYCVKDMGFVLSNISMSGQFTQHIFISFMAGLVLAF